MDGKRLALCGVRSLVVVLPLRARVLGAGRFPDRTLTDILLEGTESSELSFLLLLCSKEKVKRKRAS